MENAEEVSSTKKDNETEVWERVYVSFKLSLELFEDLAEESPAPKASETEEEGARADPDTKKAERITEENFPHAMLFIRSDVDEVE